MFHCNQREKDIQQPTTNNQQRTTNNQEPTTNNQQPTTTNHPPTTTNQQQQPPPPPPPLATLIPRSMRFLSASGKLLPNSSKALRLLDVLASSISNQVQHLPYRALMWVGPPTTNTQQPQPTTTKGGREEKEEPPPHRLATGPAAHAHRCGLGCFPNHRPVCLCLWSPPCCCYCGQRDASLWPSGSFS